MKSIFIILLFAFTTFVIPTKPEPPAVRCAGIMCNDEDFFFYNYNNYLYFPIVESGGNQ
jgi:hypothetical protein